MAAKEMLLPDDVRARARTRYERNWRDWAAAEVVSQPNSPEPILSVALNPPRESDVGSADGRERARAWVLAWRACSFPGAVEWKRRSWARIGDQEVPVRIVVEGEDAIACWVGLSDQWRSARARARDVALRLQNSWRVEMAANPSAENGDSPESRIEAAVRACIGAWCALDEDDWRRVLGVLEWLLAHEPKGLYVRQLPIRGIDTKWMETHGGCIRPLYQALMGGDFAFRQPRRLFRCKACCDSTMLGQQQEFALDARGLARLRNHPRRVVICENLVNTLCLDAMPGTLAIHGGGYAVGELRELVWLADAELLYWGDLDTHGFAILDMLRSFAPHAQSRMMDEATLERYLDLCVEEPKPSLSPCNRLNAAESRTLALLREGDAARGIASLRLEQERIPWEWAFSRLA